MTGNLQHCAGGSGVVACQQTITTGRSSIAKRCMSSVIPARPWETAWITLRNVGKDTNECGSMSTAEDRP